MPYPDDLLSDGERVILHKHSHWKMLLVPYLVLVVTLGIGIWLAVLVQDQSWNMVAWIAIAVIGVAVLIWLFFVPFLRWRTTHFIVTTDRVMAREGVVNRTGIDIPLGRVNSVRFEHGLVDRIFGCGTLIIESASQEPLEFDDIPKVEMVHTLIYREVNDNPHDDFKRGGTQEFEPGTFPAEGEPRVAELTARDLGLPVRVPGEDLPAAVTVWEVGPRDGLQNEQVVVPVAVKLEFLDRLADAGLTTIEATSFVHPKWVPQLADAEELLAGLSMRDGVRYPVLVPNERGLDRALAAGVRHIAIFGSATETFANRNLNRTLDEQFTMFEPVVSRAVAEGLDVRGYVSMCFGDPWEGPVDPAAVVSVGRRLLDMGCSQLSLGDTIGVATAGQVSALLAAFAAAGTPMADLAVHFHDTYGQALANTLAALRHGVTTVDSSAGGLGGCPYAESATGNLATEDLVWLLDGLGVATGVDLDKLADASAWLAGELGRPSPSRVVRALRG